MAPLGRVILVERTFSELPIVKMVTWQPVDEAPVAKVQVIVMLPLSSITAMEDWRPVVSVSGKMNVQGCRLYVHVCTYFYLIRGIKSNTLS